MLNFSDACERNKEPILGTLRDAFAECRNVLEIGSGSGQHAIHFGRRLPHLTWQTSELAVNLPALEANINEFGSENIRLPVELDVSRHPWPVGQFHGLFTANTFHIMSWPHVTEFFKGAGQALENGGLLCVYGPFSHGGHYSSASNEKFDTFLKLQDPESGIRDLDDIEPLAIRQDLKLIADKGLPANNEILIWRRYAGD